MVVTKKDLDPFIEDHPAMGPFEADMGRGRQSLALHPKGTTVTYRATPTPGELRKGGTGIAGGQKKAVTAHHVERNFPREGGLPFHEEGTTHKPYRTRKETFDKVDYLDVKPVVGDRKWPSRVLFPYQPSVREVESIEHDIIPPQTTKFTGGGYSVVDLQDIDIPADVAEQQVNGLGFSKRMISNGRLPDPYGKGTVRDPYSTDSRAKGSSLRDFGFAKRTRAVFDTDATGAKAPVVDPEISSAVMPARKIGLRDIDIPAEVAEQQALADIDETAGEAEAEALSHFEDEENQLGSIFRRIGRIGRKIAMARKIGRVSLDAEEKADYNREIGHLTEMIAKIATKAATQVVANAEKGKYANVNHARQAVLQRALAVTRQFGHDIQKVAVKASNDAFNAVSPKVEAAIAKERPKAEAVALKPVPIKAVIEKKKKKLGWVNMIVAAMKRRGYSDAQIRNHVYALARRRKGWGWRGRRRGGLHDFLTEQDEEDATVHLGTVSAFVTSEDLARAPHLGDFLTEQDEEDATEHLGRTPSWAGRRWGKARRRWTRRRWGKRKRWERYGRRHGWLGDLGHDDEDIEAALSHIEDETRSQIEGMGVIPAGAIDAAVKSITGTVGGEVAKAAAAEGKTAEAKAKEPTTADWINKAINVATGIAGGYMTAKIEKEKRKAAEAAAKAVQFQAEREARRAGMSPVEKAVDVVAPPDVPFYQRPLFLGGAGLLLLGLGYMAFKPSGGSGYRSRPRRRRRR